MGGFVLKVKIPLKYVLLYGPTGVGKTFMLYSTQAKFNNVISNLTSTEGVNYEEININKAKYSLGVFDISGDLKQHNLVNILMKSIRIEGIIFLVPIEKIEQYPEFKSELIRVLNNKHLDSDNLVLMVIYNIKSELKDKLNWIDEGVLDNKLNLKKIKEDFPNIKIKSKIADINSTVTDENDLQELLVEYCDLFSDDN
jgi:predicted translin family RNA/ssDNA-binding protein